MENSSTHTVTKAALPQARLEQKTRELLAKDAELAALASRPDVGEALRVPGLTLAKTIDTALEGYAERPALGERDYQIAMDPASGKSVRQYQARFKTISYAELQTRVKALANAWRNHPEHRVEPTEFVCMLGFASIDFVVLDYACAYLRAVAVPMQTKTSGADIDEILANMAPASLAASINDLVIAAKHAVTHGGIRSLVAFDYDHRDDNERAQFEEALSILEAAGVNTKLVTLAELERFGHGDDWEFLPPGEEGDEELASVMHSSGSTGKPKGAMLSVAALKFIWAGMYSPFPMVMLGLAPLNHLLGKSSVNMVLKQGGTVYFTLAPDLSTLFDDIRLARPTIMSFFPRVFELIYQHYQNEVTRRVSAGEGSEEDVSQKVTQEMGSNFLGDRLLTGSVGGAPTSPAVREFIVDCFDILLTDGYGNTECGAGIIAMNGIVQRPPVTDYKLRDVPELGYYTTDKPYPRGEFCYKSVVGISGFYKDPEATANLYDEDGYSLTGDIVEEHGPDHIVVIDRSKDVLKLSQGEYVAIGILGTRFEAGSAVINQIYVYGNSLRAYLLAVAVPDEEVAIARLGKGYGELELKNLIRDELRAVADKEGLKNFEVPRDFIIEYEPFSQENGLLSSLRKRLRPALAKKYGVRLEALYDEQQRAQEEELKALQDPDSPLSVLEKLNKLLEIDLKIQDIDPSKPRTYSELGGDSLGASMFSLSIEEVFGVSVPADTILSPTGSLRKWAELIEQQLSGGGDRPTFAGIHGKDASHISVDDLDLAEFIDQETLRKATGLPGPAAAHDTVLLTGGNGFLGHIVCLEWLEKLALTGGKLICLVRGTDNAAAKARLDLAFEGVDAALEAKYKDLADGHLEVLAGDTAEPLLGLCAGDYSRLAAEVDRVTHVAALVNHRFNYQNLFGPNVVGTAEIIRFALTARKKPIDFVSTVAVCALVDTSKENNEDSPLLQTIPLAEHYVAGYAASKWAGEYLLQQANRLYQLPVNTFRGDMMLPDRRFQGQMNVADMFSRLLFSVVVTGLAPYSFYERNEDGSKKRAHYDATPVDVVAVAVAGVADNTGDYRTYNLHNYHAEDGCSLDAFVDWIEAAGVPITRIDDHAQWFDRFQDNLNALPNEQRHQSALDILPAFALPMTVSDVQVGCEHFKRLVKDLSVGPEVPHIDQPYIGKCLDDLVVLGLIDAQVGS